jgi:hypothetical protein
MITPPLQSLFRSLVAVLTLLVLSQLAQAQTYTVVYSFASHTCITGTASRRICGPTTFLSPPRRFGRTSIGLPLPTFRQTLRSDRARK